jgi:hypothetical protein
MDVLLKPDRVGLVPHSNHPFVASPFGFTPLFKTPPVMVTDVAAFVVTVGGKSAIVPTVSAGPVPVGV